MRRRRRLDVDLMVSSESIRDGIRSAIMTDWPSANPTWRADGTWQWALDSFGLRMHHVDLGPLGDRLTIVGRKGRKEQAGLQIAERRAAIRPYLTGGAAPSTVAIVELADAFNDPHRDGSTPSASGRWTGIYPVVFLDALVFKVRGGAVARRGPWKKRSTSRQPGGRHWLGGGGWWVEGSRFWPAFTEPHDAAVDQHEARGYREHGEGPRRPRHFRLHEHAGPYKEPHRQYGHSHDDGHRAVEERQPING
jgi:hypothetical protein